MNAKVLLPKKDKLDILRINFCADTSINTYKVKVGVVTSVQ